MKSEELNFALLEPESVHKKLPEHSLDGATIVIAVLILAIAIAAILFWKNRKRAIDPHAEQKRAFKQASEALNRLTEMDTRASALSASHILREYLEQSERDSALFETHEEFSLRADALGHLGEQTRTHLYNYFAKLSRCKYASDLPPMQPSAIIHEGIELLNSLNREHLA
ncbi:MAG: hypothetical protein EAZ42_06350 [Verrucomicrobia bacterium]|nr:MAG: hypothetical protein EAZ42_06350 [Verrucomicrobiota bacterium]